MSNTKMSSIKLSSIKLSSSQLLDKLRTPVVHHRSPITISTLSNRTSLSSSSTLSNTSTLSNRTTLSNSSTLSNTSTLSNRTTVNKKSIGKVFYVCSFGGCGSKMLCEYLKHFGTVKHVHSRRPPTKLTHVGSNEWFNNIPVEDKYLKSYYVIYIYRDPVKAILSRFGHPEHLNHIQANPNTSIKDIITSKQDLYGSRVIYHSFPFFHYRHVY